ncbi:MAG TPA: carbohydrate ABC transporter permease [Candidatus Faecimorpha stercoravium]|nr:carbohydrate ABC transporter permease [Candidatus Faecimorpha stercoravium]
MVVYKKTPMDHVFTIINTLLMIFLMVITLYPFVYVLFASLSDPNEFIAHSGTLLYPLSPNLDSYWAVLNNPNILIGYKNTILIVVVGTGINLLMTCVGAYFLSRTGPMLKKPIMILITVTMFVDGGMIPNYLLVRDLGMYDTLWALIIPGAISTYNMIIMRTMFQSIPASLEESARIDGAGEWTILFKLILPLSIPTIAVIGLFYAVGHWNSWFSANIYLRDKNKFPLQLILRDIVVESEVDDMTIGAAFGNSYAMSFTIKYATVIVATVPILVLYPWIQKYFVKGVMIGSLKG